MRPWSEPTLFRVGYANEQLSKNRQPPLTTPALPGERFEY
jgi:amidase